jgi:hypothetical protein
VTRFTDGQRVADLGGGYWTIVWTIANPGEEERCLVRHDNGDEDSLPATALVALEPCPGCGVLTEPYAPCGSPQCMYKPTEEDT